MGEFVPLDEEYDDEAYAAYMDEFEQAEPEEDKQWEDHIEEEEKDIRCMDALEPVDSDAVEICLRETNKKCRMPQWKVPPRCLLLAGDPKHHLVYLLYGTDPPFNRFLKILMVWTSTKAWIARELLSDLTFAVWPPGLVPMVAAYADQEACAAWIVGPKGDPLLFEGNPVDVLVHSDTGDLWILTWTSIIRISEVDAEGKNCKFSEIKLTELGVFEPPNSMRQVQGSCSCGFMLLNKFRPAVTFLSHAHARHDGTFTLEKRHHITMETSAYSWLLANTNDERLVVMDYSGNVYKLGITKDEHAVAVHWKGKQSTSSAKNPRYMKSASLRYSSRGPDSILQLTDMDHGTELFNIACLPADLIDYCLVDIKRCDELSVKGGMTFEFSIALVRPGIVSMLNVSIALFEPSKPLL